MRGRTFLGFTIDERTEMWNSDVVGVGVDNVRLLQRSLDLCDAMTAAGVSNRLVEQLSQTVVLQSTGRLREATPWIDHYWGNKPGYDVAVHEQLAAILVRGMHVQRAIEYVREHPIEKPLRVSRAGGIRISGGSRGCRSYRDDAVSSAPVARVNRGAMADERRHSTLGYLSPGEFERAARMAEAA